MLTSMTGFGGKTAEVKPFGKITVELRSTNHKFLETVLHMPEGFMSLEDRIKKEIESQVKRGRINCVINISGSQSPGVSINEKLLKNYLSSLRTIKKKYKVEGDVGLDALINLPGVLSLSESVIPKERIWPELKKLVDGALNNFISMRKKEGRALQVYLKKRTSILNTELTAVKTIYKEVSIKKAGQLKTAEEKSSFLKDSDISEEIERLGFHIKNFIHKISKPGSVGKELDFIAQEMQREANTIGAKSCDSFLSAKVVHIKSQIEKIREQVQNVE